jgi:hypothetical protein
MRIFIGLTEIANIADTYGRAFRALGHETVSMIWKRNRFYPSGQYDIVLNKNSSVNKGWSEKIGDAATRLGAARYLPRMIRECDVFLFIFGSAFLPGALDYALIKQAGKKIVSTFWGSEIRYGYALEQESEALGFADEIRPFLETLKSQRGNYYQRLNTIGAAEKYADLILSQQGYGQLQTRPYMRANVPVDVGSFLCKIPAREKPLILHAPSKRDIKGTPVVLQTIEELREEGSHSGFGFDFRLIENMPNPEVRANLVEADIVVDELYSETVGMLSSEAMASGCVAVTRYMQAYGKVPPDCPAVNANRYTLKAELRRLITDLPRRVEIASAGRPFVAEHYDAKKVAGQILGWLEAGGITRYDYTPQFYRSLRMPQQLLMKERKEALLFWKK